MSLYDLEIMANSIISSKCQNTNSFDKLRTFQYFLLAGIIFISKDKDGKKHTRKYFLKNEAGVYGSREKKIGAIKATDFAPKKELVEVRVLLKKLSKFSEVIEYFLKKFIEDAIAETIKFDVKGQVKVEKLQYNSLWSKKDKHPLFKSIYQYFEVLNDRLPVDHPNKSKREENISHRRNIGWVELANTMIMFSAQYEGVLGHTTIANIRNYFHNICGKAFKH